VIIIKNKQAIMKMRTAGRLLAGIFESLDGVIKQGMSTLDINDYIEKEMLKLELKPVCKGFHGYKHATCISVNDVVVHGVPSQSIIVKSGDLVKVDVVGSYKGYCADMARCFFVGDVSPVAKKLAHVARTALDRAIDAIKPGIHLSEISVLIQQEVEQAGFGVVRAFAGHGIGKNMHEEPEVPNFKTSEKGPILREGMVLAIEPMITEHGYKVTIDKDGWTARTADGGLAGHVEDTVLVTDQGAEVLTKFD
jgi:methionyl aminopeptidase